MDRRGQLYPLQMSQQATATSDATPHPATVTLCTSARWGRSPDAVTHLVVDAAGWQVLACTGGAPANLREVPYHSVGGSLGCALCRKFWKRAGAI